MSTRPGGAAGVDGSSAAATSKGLGGRLGGRGRSAARRDSSGDDGGGGGPASRRRSQPRGDGSDAESAQLTPMSDEDRHHVDVDDEQDGDAADQQTDEQVQH